MPIAKRYSAALLGVALACGAFAEDLAPAPLDPPAQPVLEEKDVVAFAQRMQNDLLEGRFKEFDANFDVDALCRKVAMTQATPTSFEKGVMSGLKDKFAVGRSLAAQLGSVSGFKFLRVRNEGGEFRAIFRVVVASGGLNYQEYIIRPTDGKPRAHDMYTLASGELISETLRRMLMPALLESRKNDGSLGENGQKLLDEANALKRFGEAVQARHPEDADLLYEALPEYHKKSKFVKMLQVVVQEGNHEAYQKALDTYAAAFPNDPSYDLLSLDAFLHRKEWQKTLDGIDRLDKRVGGDPYLNFLRANIYILEEKYGDAKASAQKAIDAEPGLQDAHLSWITATLKEKKFEETVKGMDRFEKIFGRIEVDLTKEIEYAPFLASDAGKAWWAAHEATAGPKMPEAEPKKTLDAKTDAEAPKP